MPMPVLPAATCARTAVPGKPGWRRPIRSSVLTTLQERTDAPRLLPLRGGPIIALAGEVHTCIFGLFRCGLEGSRPGQSQGRLHVVLRERSGACRLCVRGLLFGRCSTRSEGCDG